MKKKILAIIIAIMMVLPLVACGESYKNPTVEGEQKDYYVVVSNGGSAVQYGNYIYFINGYRGYDDDGSDNYWPNVVKGGLFRAELKGEDANFEYMTAFGTYLNSDGKMVADYSDIEESKMLKTFKSVFDIDKKYEFDTEPTVFVTKEDEEPTGYEKGADGKIVYNEDGDPVELDPKKVAVPVTYKIAGKTIGTRDYDKGGIFIYDDCVYYATPSNEQNRDGEIETGKTTFYCTKLDGTKTIKLYTSANETSGSEYAFYKQNDKVYLVVHDGDKIISVTVGDKNKKKDKKVESVNVIATDVESVLFPVKDVYFKNINTNQAEDFIYYTREINENDKQRVGNVAFAMRPDGSECIRFLETGYTVTFKNVNGGYLFYEEARNGGNVIYYTNMHDQFMIGSSSYKKDYEANKDVIVSANGGEHSPLIGGHSGTAYNREETYNEITCFRPSMRSNQVFALCRDSNAMRIYDSADSNPVTIYNGSISYIFDIQGANVYFGDSDGNYYYTNVYTKADSNEVVTIGKGMNTTATFKLDVVGDLVMMFGNVDLYASDYALFVDCRYVDDGARFVGEKAEEDKYDPTVELNADEDAE